MAFPKALAAWAALGGVTAFRALVRPARALVDEGDVVTCPGAAGCSAALTMQSARGVGRVYALVAGRVTRTGSGAVEIASSREAVLVGLTGPDLTPLVGAGQVVKAGQVVATARTVSLTVTGLGRTAGGGVSAVALEPATWLASRGLRAATRSNPSALWCAQGRKLVIPQAVGQCGIRLPDPAGFALLPVSARLE